MPVQWSVDGKDVVFTDPDGNEIKQGDLVCLLEVECNKISDLAGSYLGSTSDQSLVGQFMPVGAIDKNRVGGMVGLLNDLDSGFWGDKPKKKAYLWVMTHQVLVVKDSE